MVGWGGVGWVEWDGAEWGGLLYEVWRLVFGIHLYPIARLEMAFWPDDDGPDQEPEPHPEEP